MYTSISVAVNAGQCAHWPVSLMHGSYAPRANMHWGAAHYAHPGLIAACHAALQGDNAKLHPAWSHGITDRYPVPRVPALTRIDTGTGQQRWAFQKMYRQGKTCTC